VSAELFHKLGATIIITDLNEEAGHGLIHSLNNERIEFYKADVTNEENIKSLVSSVIKKHKKIDVLVNNAGITLDGLLMKMDTEKWKKVIDVNLTGVFICTKTVIPHMVEQGKGVILNASSVVGLYGNIGQTNYAATKAGVIGLTKTWAKELGPRGIRVNAVAPGFIKTDMTAKVPQKILDLMESQTPLKMLGEPIDIANAYLFLASDMARYVNGAILSVDGGLVT
jgi:3-oxoacyl-[acyl-carrier protein] reductase